MTRKRVLHQFIGASLSTVLVLTDYSAFAAPANSPAALNATTSPSAPPIPATRDPLIEVSVDTLEISETNTNNLGLTWGQNGGTNSTTGQPILDANHLSFNETAPVPAIFETGKLIRNPLFIQLQALIQNDQARILANPTLLTKSGFEATFLVGGEIPYPTVGQGGVGGVEFKKYGVSLKILPVLTPKQTIDAQINVAVSEPDESVAIILPGSTSPTPGLSAREAGSKVEVKDGETVVLAGIKQSRREKVVTRVPVLGYIPLLGLLFTSKTDAVQQTSLVFFVTFHLVK